MHIQQVVLVRKKVRCPWQTNSVLDWNLFRMKWRWIFGLILSSLRSLASQLMKKLCHQFKVVVQLAFNQVISTTMTVNNQSLIELAKNEINFRCLSSSSASLRLTSLKVMKMLSQRTIRRCYQWTNLFTRCVKSILQ